MIDPRELNVHCFPVMPIVQKNLDILFERLMDWQAVYVGEGGPEFIITSGLRDDAMQAQLIKDGKSNSKHSKHCIGAAADIYDPYGKLAAWVLANLDYCKGHGLYFEDPTYTRGWLHIQVYPPMSGKTIFIP